ncbi:phytanoyl-CoA dioxygenase family protein [Mesorhizobium australicum]|uniref:phytanoyl-CoA dioxygenase family protein n=1 Tax=Mesorhizobium australicum TaxID=536018 RepID=UPI00333D563D
MAPQTAAQPIDSEIVDAQTIADYQRDGAVCIRGAFKGWVDAIAAGIERNMRSRSATASDIAGGKGSFFDDYCNWERIPEFVDVVRNSPAARLAAAVMQSRTAQFFHDHVLVKEPGTQKPTPWHQDIPYYFVDGQQTVSFWIPIDPVKEATLRLIAGSHKWDKMILPVRWLDDGDFYAAEGDYRPVPDPDTDPSMKVIEWEMEPGDAILFDFRTAHGARGNMTAARRRALSLRWVGDDAHYVERPGRTSPPYPGHGMQPGQKLREDWFPVVFQG